MKLHYLLKNDIIFLGEIDSKALMIQWKLTIWAI